MTEEDEAPMASLLTSHCKSEGFFRHKILGGRITMSDEKSKDAISVHFSENTISEYFATQRQFHAEEMELLKGMGTALEKALPLLMQQIAEDRSERRADREVEQARIEKELERTRLEAERSLKDDEFERAMRLLNAAQGLDEEAQNRMTDLALARLGDTVPEAKPTKTARAKTG